MPRSYGYSPISREGTALEVAGGGNQEYDGRENGFF